VRSSPHASCGLDGTYEASRAPELIDKLLDSTLDALLESEADPEHDVRDDDTDVDAQIREILAQRLAPAPSSGLRSAGFSTAKAVNKGCASRSAPSSQSGLAAGSAGQMAACHGGGCTSEDLALVHWGSRLSELVNCRRDVSLEMAQRLGQAFRNGTRFWMALQMQRNIWLADRRNKNKISVSPLEWTPNAA